MDKIFLNVKDGQDIAFIGKEVAHQHEPEKDVAFRVYETEKGHWVVTITSNENILLKHEVINNKSVEKLVKTLGYTDCAKSIYSKLGVDTTLNLDI
ncbi:TPA: hypothetical protein MYV55_001481 [Klebsiella aerogenes]|uniref:hypothetical protein n=1 Tax=Klebsiella aerogenes TaxID=548 RepID=UPI0038901223|nr:hypothetical protein [Klebsiella aerogenes]HCM1706942.1 hypothetical protein [Klebsiella aerogenes]